MARIAVWGGWALSGVLIATLAGGSFVLIGQNQELNAAHAQNNKLNEKLDVASGDLEDVKDELDVATDDLSQSESEVEEAAERADNAEGDYAECSDLQSQYADIAETLADAFQQVIDDKGEEFNAASVIQAIAEYKTLAGASC